MEINYIAEWILMFILGLSILTTLWEKEYDDDVFYTPRTPEIIFEIHSPLPNQAKSLQSKNSNSNSVIFKSDKIPIIVRWDRLNSEPDSRPKITSCGDIKCNVTIFPQRIPSGSLGAYLFHLLSVDFADLPLPRYPNNILWAITLPESPKNMLFFHETVLKLFNYSSTFSRHSDVPLFTHLISLDDITNTKYFLKTPTKNSFLEEIAPIMYLQTNCGSLSQRDAYVEELMKYQRVDAYGPCLNNKKLPDGLRVNYLDNLMSEELLEFMARYKFVIAIENAVCEDYLTEKFWRAIIAGVVPIYFGCPTIREWLPNKKSAVLLQDFPTPKLLSDHIERLLDDDDLYEEYLQHKTKGLISNVALVNRLKDLPSKKDFDGEFICFLCVKLHRLGDGLEHRVINRSHYDCPTPISALAQRADPSNLYVKIKYSIKNEAQNLYQRIRNTSR